MKGDYKKYRMHLEKMSVMVTITYILSLSQQWIKTLKRFESVDSYIQYPRLLFGHSDQNIHIFSFFSITYKCRARKSRLFFVMLQDSQHYRLAWYS